MNKSFTLIVTKSPFDSRNAENAYDFCIAAIQSGHKIEQVFFYQSGVHNASSLLEANNDEIDMKRRWISLNKEYGVALNVCTTAGARRGVTSEQSSSIEQRANIKSPFVSVGLSAYFEALANNTINIQL